MSVKLFIFNVVLVAKLFFIGGWKYITFWAALLPVGGLILNMYDRHGLPTIGTVLLAVGVFAEFILCSILLSAAKLTGLENS